MLAPEQANQASCLNENNYLKACRAKWVKHFSFSPKLCTRHVSVELKTTKAVVNKNLPQRLSCFLACVVKTETEKNPGLSLISEKQNRFVLSLITGP